MNYRLRLRALTEIVIIILETALSSIVVQAVQFMKYLALSRFSLMEKI
jgi:hypothetical protein